MDTKPQVGEQEQQGTLGHEASPAAESTTTSSSPVQTPPERLSEKRRREEEDEDELVKLTTTPKRRSSSAGSGTAGPRRGKRNLSLGSTEKGVSQGLKNNMTGNAAPKRIAINLGSTATKPSPTETSSIHLSAAEKESQEDTQAGEGE